MGDIYNNDVTYAKKWDTPENEAALRLVERKYFHRSVCYPSCPTGWAPEVLELMDYLDKEFGIAYNTQTFMAYAPRDRWYNLLTWRPFVNVFNSIVYNFFQFRFDDEDDKRYYKSKTFKKRFSYVLDSFTSTYRYGRSMFRVQVFAPIYNKIYKPKVNLSQLKEKYGRLEVYYSAPEYLREHIDYMICKTEIKLALKGCYYPLENYYNAGWSTNVGTEYTLDDIEVKNKKYSDGTAYRQRTHYCYRRPMKDLGLSLQDIEAKANEKKKKRKTAGLGKNGAKVE